MANLRVIKNSKSYKSLFQKDYPKFSNYLDTEEFKIIFSYLLSNKEKLIWAIEDLEKPPLEGVGKSLVQLDIDFENPNLRRLTGAIVKFILKDEYIPYKSGCRISWKPFITSSKYRKRK